MFMISTHRKLGIKKNFLNLIKSINKNSIDNNILKSENLKTFPFSLRIGQGCPLSTLFFNTILEVLAKAKKQNKTHINK